MLNNSSLTLIPEKKPIIVKNNNKKVRNVSVAASASAIK